MPIASITLSRKDVVLRSIRETRNIVTRVAAVTPACVTGLSKFAKLARSVTRSRSVLVSALPALKEPARQSQLAHVSTAAHHVNTHALLSLALELAAPPAVTGLSLDR